MRRIVSIAALALAACNSNTPGIVFTVTLSPSAATVTAGKTLQLGAIAKGALTWAVQESGGGSIDANGLYTAPATPGTYHVTATSVDDPKKTASATVTVVAAAATPVIALDRLITTGKSKTASVAPQDGVTFAWTAFNGNLAATTGASVDVAAGDVGELVVTCVATNAAGDSSAEGVAIATVLPAPTSPAISAPYAVTAGRANLAASVPSAPGFTYKWTIGNGAIAGSSTGSTLVFTAGTAGDLSLSVVASNGAGDAAPASNATVHVHSPGVELVAGAPGGPGNADDKGADARFHYPFGVAADPAGNLLVTDYLNNDVRKVAPDGTVTTFAGLAGQYGNQDGVGPGARFSYPQGIATDSPGNAYVLDYQNQVIRRVAPDGTTTTIAGQLNVSGADDGPALGGGHLYYPRVIAVTADAGSIWIGDFFGQRIRVLQDDGGTPWVTTKATMPNYSLGIAIAPQAVLFSQACSVVALDGGIWTVAGNASACGQVDDVGGLARFGQVQGVVVDPSGGVAYVGDNSGLIRRLDYDAGSNEWLVSTVAGVPGDAGVEDGPAAAARLRNPNGLARLPSGAIAFTESSDNVVRTLAGGVVQTLAGTPQHSGHLDGPGPSARFQTDYDGYIAGVAVDDDGSAYVTDSLWVRRIAPDGTVTTVAGNGQPVSVDGLAASASFQGLEAIALDRTNRILYLTDANTHTIRTVTYDPAFGADVVHTVAGTPNNCFLGDGAADAGFCNPTGLALDSAGRLYVADQGNQAIRVVERTEDGGGYEVTTIASGQQCGPAAPAAAPLPPAIFGGLCSPSGIAVDQQGRVFITDSGNHAIKMLEVDAGAWAISTIAGHGSCASQDMEGADAGFCTPWGVAVDRDGNVWIGDQGNATLRKLTFNGASGKWKAETMAGILSARGVKPGPLPGRMNQIGGIAATPTGDVMVVDSMENSVLLVRPQ